MSQTNSINHELMISGSGDACPTTNPDKQINFDKSKIPSNDVLLNKKVKKGREQICDWKKRAQLRRALTLNDMSPPQKRDRLQKYEHTSINIEKNEFLEKQLIMSKLLSTLYYKLWKKKKTQCDESKEQIKQLLIQKSFLNQMREKESKKRDELSKLTERLNRTITERETRINNLKEERDSLKQNLHNASNSLSEISLELEKTEYLKTKFQKNNYEHLEHMHHINEELAKLKQENKEQKQKILYMNNVADQQDYNLKHLHKIAEDLDVSLKENVEYTRSILKTRDEAIEKEEQTTYRLKMLEASLKECKETEKNLRLEMNQIKRNADEAQKHKLLISLENVDLKYKLESTEDSLKTVLAQMKQLEAQNEACKVHLMLREFRQKILKAVPWQNLLQIGIHFFPIISSSLNDV